ncbi:MAG TPA: hypothetical protein VEL76_04910 [Gemmataceae bacterium]|nr:hypothetical protein [Gemmataceae bacterium]
MSDEAQGTSGESKPGKKNQKAAPVDKCRAPTVTIDDPKEGVKVKMPYTAKGKITCPNGDPLQEPVTYQIDGGAAQSATLGDGAVGGSETTYPWSADLTAADCPPRTAPYALTIIARNGAGVGVNDPDRHFVSVA